MKVHVLHLESREDRKLHMLKQAEKQGFDIGWWINEPNKKNPKLSIHSGHQRIVQYAKDNNMPEICIGEDDMRFFHPTGFQYFIDNKPASYDLYMAVIFVGEIRDGKAASQFSGGTTLYFISEKFYDFFLSRNPDSHVDRDISQYCDQFDFYLCPKIPLTQMGGYSNQLRRSIPSYSVYLQGRERFNG